jgi:hypothetical protein
MRMHRFFSLLLGLSLLAAASVDARAAEYAFGTYGLGGNAFGAGVTPPAGTYVTTAYSYYTATIGTTVNFDTVTLNAGARAQAFTSALNLLYVPERKLFGGSLGLSVTIPVSHVDYLAGIGIGSLAATQEVAGWGLGDIVPRAELGWQHGEFAHLVYLQVVTPTGFWEHGFSPIVGFHRPGIDTGWAFTWQDKQTKLQLNGAAGFTFNFENTATNYQTGDEFHFEWAVGIECAPGLVLGVAGYAYRQLTGDSGSGDKLGPFKGSVDAIGPGLSYTTLIGKTPFIFNLRRYTEFNATNHFEGNSTIASGTVRF